MQNKKFYNKPKENQPQEKKGGFRNFFDSGKKMTDHIRPGEPFLFEDSFKPKKSFPFLTPTQALKKHLHLPEERAKPLEKGTLRVIPFGGTEQVGLNCMGFEYEDEMIIVDMGLQFADQYQYGINSSIPDLTYVRGKKVVGVCITHGHIDHIGGVYYLMEQLGRGTPLFATAMAYELIKLKQGDMKATLTKLSEYVRYRPIQLGKHFQITPFVVDHSIPDSVGLLIETPVGRFVHTGDWKFDKNPLPNRPSSNYEWIEATGKRGIRALFSDSTNAHLMGSSISESEVVHSMEDIFEKAPARVITATFSSIIDRVMLIISTAEKYGRKVVLLGRSMNNYVDIAIKLGYVRPKPGTIISMEEAAKLPDKEVTICCTGAQGERYAALMRIVTGESKETTLKPDDSIIFSSSVIPGNERAVQGLFDLITQQGPRIHHYKESEIHAGGHAREEDTKKMINLLKPEYYVPVYGFPHMLRGNARNAYDLGYPKNKVPILRNGKLLEFTRDSMRETDQYVSKKLITVDGRMVGYTCERELHDRYQISSQWVLVVGISKKSNGFVIKYDTVGLPPIAEVPGLERSLDQTIRNILQDLSGFKDATAFAQYVEKKACDVMLHQVGKEPKVVVVVQ
jgi:ribonuclease J